MKKFIVSLALIVCACTFMFAGCGSKGLTDNPATDAVIIGNGGYAIEKGDYLYYINGYVDGYKDELSNYKTDNVFGKVVYGAIYRTKLVNGELDKNKKGFLNKTECVVSKVVGYENGGFYIVGDYIYYATPNMTKNSDGVLENTRIVINRININGTSNKEIYVTDAAATGADWHVSVLNNKTYIVVTETFEEYKTVKSFADNGKSFKATVVAEKAKEVVVNKSDVHIASENIFFTRSVTEEDEDYTTTGTLVCRASIVDGETKPYELDKTSTFNLKALANGRLYVQNGSILYAYLANESLTSDQNKPVQLNLNEYSSFYTVSGVPYSIVAVDGSNNLVTFENVEGNAERNKIELASNIGSVVEVSEDYVYYADTTNNLLYRVSLSGGDTEKVSGTSEGVEKTYFINNASLVDVDSRYVYAFASYTAADGETKSYYLNRIDTFDTEMVGEFVGNMADEHMVADPNADIEEGQEKKEIWIY